MNIKQILKLLAPYIAVGVFWCIFSNAWLAILAYHLQVLLWSSRKAYIMNKPKSRGMMLMALPTLVAGPLLYFLLPYITHVELSEWLNHYHLTGLSLIIMIPYFGIIHPFLEQVHWAPLRDKTPLAHFMFAGYHMLVLHSLLTPPWLITCFILLASASFIWKIMTQQSKTLALPILSHILADLGVVITAWLIS
jgi:hypothetical protein